MIVEISCSEIGCGYSFPITNTLHQRGFKPYAIDSSIKMVAKFREDLPSVPVQCSPQQWNEALCKEWMQMAPEHAGILYIDDHVRVYNGQQTKLPRQ